MYYSHHTTKIHFVPVNRGQSGIHTPIFSDFCYFSPFFALFLPFLPQLRQKTPIVDGNKWLSVCISPIQTIFRQKKHFWGHSEWIFTPFLPFSGSLGGGVSYFWTVNASLPLPAPKKMFYMFHNFHWKWKKII